MNNKTLNPSLKKITDTTPPLANNGFGYFIKGFELIRSKGIRRFVFIPLFINIVLFSTAFYFMFLQLEHYMVIVMQWLPTWLEWLSVVLWPMAVLTVLILFSFLFSTLANWLAAPFNGLLSEKIEAILTNELPPKGRLGDIAKDIPRTLSREWIKFRYYFPKAIAFFLLMLFIPVIGQVIWFLFIAWMMAVQYKDYPFDNHKIPFDTMKQALKQHQGLSYSFGITVAFFSMIPIVNLIVMPVAICGATALWVDNYKNDFS